jgi:hypothetical protein
MSFDHVNDLRMELEYSPPYELYEDHRLRYKSNIIRKGVTPVLTEKK